LTKNLALLTVLIRFNDESACGLRFGPRCMLRMCTAWRSSGNVLVRFGRKTFRNRSTSVEAGCQFRVNCTSPELRITVPLTFEDNSVTLTDTET